MRNKSSKYHAFIAEGSVSTTVGKKPAPAGCHCGREILTSQYRGRLNWRLRLFGFDIAKQVNQCQHVTAWGITGHQGA
jgi:hypothetical protein